jgi:hypothetical protein
LADTIEGVLVAEAGYEQWGLLHRLQRLLDVMDTAVAAGERVTKQVLAVAWGCGLAFRV